MLNDVAREQTWLHGKARICVLIIITKYRWASVSMVSRKKHIRERFQCERGCYTKRSQFNLAKNDAHNAPSKSLTSALSCCFCNHSTQICAYIVKLIRYILLEIKALQLNLKDLDLTWLFLTSQFYIKHIVVLFSGFNKS